MAQAFPQPEQRQQFLNWFYTYGVEECNLWPFLNEEEQKLVLSIGEPFRSRLRAAIAKQQYVAPKRRPFAKRKFGVNVIGYAFGQLGVGEDSRMATRALLAARVPVTLVDFQPGDAVPQNDASMAKHVSKNGDYAINMFCMTAEENARFYLERSSGQFNDRYSIGYWPWELGKFPKDWEMVLELVDEVWVSTQHTYNSLRPVCSKPLQVMPMAVELGEVMPFANRKLARAHFKLPQAAKLFCFAFDLNSYIHRKNPQACIDAFLQAFPLQAKAGADVGLVIKVHKPVRKNPLWERLKKLAARDPRIHIIEGTLPRPELLALYQACDCFVSLHRAEGFGRGLAEALQLGLHVICTGYSGNVDFCHPPYADLVRYQLVKVRASEYTQAKGQVWAEPDVKHAAQLMKQFVRNPPKRRKRKWPEFSAAVVGKRYEKRLREIMKLAPAVPSSFREKS
ncbi:MAG TPA: glycosyltransferase [Candidatus Acidoferrum sp.]|nr:glycosyltransferase [Candidatus Acidoferrum sp.]